MLGWKRCERPSTQRAPATGSMIATGSVRGKCRAVAPPAGLNRLRRGAAVRAEAVARMPVDEGLALRERRQMLDRDQAAHRDRAQIHDLEVTAVLERRCGIRLDRDRKPWRAIDEAQEGHLPRIREGA